MNDVKNLLSRVGGGVTSRINLITKLDAVINRRCRMSEAGACEDHPEGRRSTVSCAQSANSYATKGQGRIGTS